MTSRLDRFHPSFSRFLGHRPTPAHHVPIAAFGFLHKLPLILESYVFTFIGAFIGVFLIEVIMSTNTAFLEVYHSPIIIASFGASAVLVFGANQVPLAQPRSFVGGQFVSALVGVCLTRLFCLSGTYVEDANTHGWHPQVAVNGALSMATALSAMQALNVVHPPAGATALLAAVQPEVIALSWHYLPIILASSLIMLGWALIINNLGRKRYPVFWWSPIPPPKKVDPPESAAENGRSPRGEGAERVLEDIPRSTAMEFRGTSETPKEAAV